MTVDSFEVEVEFEECTSDSYQLEDEMQGLCEKSDVSEERKKEESLEELKKVKKMEEDVPEELPITNRRSASAAKIQRKIEEMRAESGKMRRDAPRTPTSLRKVKKNVRNSNVSSSPSLKLV